MEKPTKRPLHLPKSQICSRATSPRTLAKLLEHNINAQRIQIKILTHTIDQIRQENINLQSELRYLRTKINNCASKNNESQSLTQHIQETNTDFINEVKLTHLALLEIRANISNIDTSLKKTAPKSKDCVPFTEK